MAIDLHKPDTWSRRSDMARDLRWQAQAETDFDRADQLISEAMILENLAKTHGDLIVPF